MLKLTKEDKVKIIDPDSSLIDILKNDGWELEEKKSRKPKKVSDDNSE